MKDETKTTIQEDVSSVDTSNSVQNEVEHNHPQIVEEVDSEDLGLRRSRRQSRTPDRKRIQGKEKLPVKNAKQTEDTVELPNIVTQSTSSLNKQRTEEHEAEKEVKESVNEAKSSIRDFDSITPSTPPRRSVRLRTPDRAVKPTVSLDNEEVESKKGKKELPSNKKETDTPSPNVDFEESSQSELRRSKRQSRTPERLKSNVLLNKKTEISKSIQFSDEHRKSPVELEETETLRRSRRQSRTPERLKGPMLSFKITPSPTASPSQSPARKRASGKVSTKEVSPIRKSSRKLKSPERLNTDDIQPVSSFSTSPKRSQSPKQRVVDSKSEEVTDVGKSKILSSSSLVDNQSQEVSESSSPSKSSSRAKSKDPPSQSKRATRSASREPTSPIRRSTRSASREPTSPVRRSTKSKSKEPVSPQSLGKTRSTRSGKKSVVASVHSMQYISEVQEDQEGDEWEEEVPQLRLDIAFIDEEQSSKSEVTEVNEEVAIPKTKKKEVTDTVEDNFVFSPPVSRSMRQRGANKRKIKDVETDFVFSAPTLAQDSPNNAEKKNRKRQKKLYNEEEDEVLLLSPRPPSPTRPRTRSAMSNNQIARVAILNRVKRKRKIMKPMTFRLKPSVPKPWFTFESD